MIHTPKESGEYLNQVNAQLTVRFEDCSYKNDEADSAEYDLKNGNTMILWFPHPKNGYKFFAVQIIDNESGENEYLSLEDGIEDLSMTQAVEIIKNKLSSIQTA